MLSSNHYTYLSAQAVRYRVPMIVRQVYRDNEGFFNSLCPHCHRTIAWEYMSFCPACGQRLCWIFLDEAEELTPPFDCTEVHGETKLNFLCRTTIQRLSQYMKNAKSIAINTAYLRIARDATPTMLRNILAKSRIKEKCVKHQNIQKNRGF